MIPDGMEPIFRVVFLLGLVTSVVLLLTRRRHLWTGSRGRGGVRAPRGLDPSFPVRGAAVDDLTRQGMIRHLAARPPNRSAARALALANYPGMSARQAAFLTDDLGREVGLG